MCKCGRRGQGTRRGVGPTSASASGLRLARAANVDSCQPGWNRIRYASLPHSLCFVSISNGTFEFDLLMRCLEKVL